MTERYTIDSISFDETDEPLQQYGITLPTRAIPVSLLTSPHPDARLLVNLTTERLRDILPMTKNIENALAFADKMHSSKLRKVLPIPYTLHPYDTAAIISSVVSDENIIIAGILHDIIEDCKDRNGNRIFTPEVIANEFGIYAADLVNAVTSDSNEVLPPDNPEERYWYWRNEKQVALNKVINHSPEAILIKTADTLSNVADFSRDREVLRLMNVDQIDEHLFRIPFKRAKDSILARYTHSTIDLSVAFRRKWEGGQNPLIKPLIMTQIELIKASDNHEFPALYEDWVNDLTSELDVLPPITYGKNN